MNKEKLRERCYEMGNSQFPIDKFYNDIDKFYNAIRDNPNFDKESAFLDLEKIVNHIEKLEKENQELKNTILSLEVDTCIPNLRKENTKLKNIIKILDREFIFKTTNVTNIVYIECEYSKGKFTKEEYTLIREVLENE